MSECQGGMIFHDRYQVGRERGNEDHRKRSSLMCRAARSEKNQNSGERAFLASPTTSFGQVEGRAWKMSLATQRAM